MSEDAHRYACLFALHKNRQYRTDICACKTSLTMLPHSSLMGFAPLAQTVRIEPDFVCERGCIQRRTYVEPMLTMPQSAKERGVGGLGYIPQTSAPRQGFNSQLSKRKNVRTDTDVVNAHATAHATSLSLELGCKQKRNHPCSF